jgi:hypothetical protein
VCGVAVPNYLEGAIEMRNGYVGCLFVLAMLCTSGVALWASHKENSLLFEFLSWIGVFLAGRIYEKEQQ